MSGTPIRRARTGVGVKLVADYEFGEGNIKMSERFLESSGLMQIDLLKDWIYDLEKEYEKRSKVYWKV
tara:strand:+ start:503 stop:706 length:204 start_codon:yes stop_codon:yes gene_type:complete